MQEWKLPGGSSDYHFCLCLREGSKGKEPKKLGKPSTRRGTFTEEQEKAISELTPESAQKIRQAFTNVAATLLCPGKNLPGVMHSCTCELPVIFMPLKVTANAGQTIGTLSDLASHTNYITYRTARRLNPN